MINWTQEDIEFISMNIVAPALVETIKGVAKEQEKLDEITDRILKSIGNAIREIRYEQERDRRFHKAMFSDMVLRNTLFTPDNYDDFYKKWCEKFDELNKEKFL